MTYYYMTYLDSADKLHKQLGTLGTALIILQLATNPVDPTRTKKFETSIS